MTRRADLGRYQAMAASLAMHAALLLAAVVVLPRLSKPIHVSDVVPVTLMTSADLANMRAAVAAPEPAPARTETPEPAAPPVQPAPEDAPQPPQPQPAPQPNVEPKVESRPAPPKPTPSKPKAAAKPAPELDLDRLAASLAKSGGARHAAAARGPVQAETALVARTTAGAGTAATASALSAYTAELQRLWNPNCDVLGGSTVNIVVTFRLGAGGRLADDPKSSADNATDSIVKVASDRAIRAVKQAPPQSNLPADTYRINFNAKDACDQR